MRDKVMENSRYKILMVEDEELYRKAFTRFVEEEGLQYDCTEAESVSEARSILSSEKFDIVLADYSLGDGTAFDILDLVKDTPIIFITGIGDEKVAVKAWKAGAYDYLIKDFERNYIKAIPITIENAIKHKKAEEQIRLLTGAVMSTDDSVYITDMEGNIIFVNKAFCETYGYEEEEIIGKHSSILSGESPQIADGEDGHQDSREVDLYHRRKDGGEFPVSLSISAIKDENGNEFAFVGVARDISERIFIEDKVRTLNLKLKRGSRIMG
jgi:PAS domain S-box-containing protein